MQSGRVVMGCVMMAVVATGCSVTDEKGNSCGALDALTNSADETYCPDDGAPDDCDDLLDDFIGAFADCGGVTEQALRAELEEGDGLPFDCANAVATTTGYDDCRDAYRPGNYTCDGSIPDVDSDICSGVILVDANE